MVLKWFKAVVFVVLSYVIPLCAHPALLGDPRIIMLMFVCMVVLLTQPELRRSDARRNAAEDGYSVYVIMVGASISQVAPVVEWAYRSDQEWSTPWFIVGVIMLLGGTAFRIWAIRTLGPRFTPAVEIQADHELVTTGPYRYAGYAKTSTSAPRSTRSRRRAIAVRIVRLPFRHPSYAGAYFAMIGSAVLLKAPVSIAVTILLMGVVYTYRIIREEEALRDRFEAAR